MPDGQSPASPRKIGGAICGGSWPKGHPISMKHELATGFGMIMLKRDDEIVWTAPLEWEYCLKPKKMRWAENQARKHPDSRWLLLFDTPFWDATFERKGKNYWPAIRTGMGIA